MKGGIVEKAMSVSKFRGALVGVLLGDCCGSPFEGEETVSKVILQRYFDKMEDPSFLSPVKKYTDDTVMTKSILESLVQHACFNEVDIAKRFVTEYFRCTNRGYGQSVVDVFQKLRTNKFQDVWRPAIEQFNGAGSLGNGGAMRITPVALFCYNNYDLMTDTAIKCTRITHTHPSGVNGALLQAMAVQQCLLEEPNNRIDNVKFTSDLIEKISKFEEHEDEFSENIPPYTIQLECVQKLLENQEASDHSVIETLGNGVRAIFSVPTAIYCFLRSQDPIQKIQTDNAFRRTVQYSISLGGDTDTIASMAGALAGAYYGFESINPAIQKHCEDVENIISLANELYENSVAVCS